MLCRLLIAALLALNASASPIVIRDSPVTLPLTRQYNFTAGYKVADADRARYQALRDRNSVQTAHTSVIPVQATNAIITYTAEVGVGQPPTYYTLLVDTGSSNTWFGARSTFTPPSTSTKTGNSFFIEYGGSLALGDEYTDTITLGGLVIPNQEYGAASLALGFKNVDGILGIGPTDLTNGTTSAGGLVSTIVDNAWNDGLLSSYEVGISFQPAISESDTTGEITFGGTNSDKYIGDLNYVPITSTARANTFVGIDQCITYGSSRLPILNTTAGFTDTGTTLVLVASEAFSAYKQATGAVLDSTTGLLLITAAQYDSLQSLFFNIGGVEYEFTKNAQIWPRTLNSAVGGNSSSIYLVVASNGNSEGSGLDFVNGYAFLERFYSVYDSGNSRFGVAQTPYTFATTN